MIRLFNRFGGKQKKRKTSAIAKQRLKTLLISDRADCSADFVDAIKGDISQSLSKYMEVDAKSVRIDIFPVETGETKEAARMLLVAKVPFREINKVIC